MRGIVYSGTVRGFRAHGLPAVRQAALRGLTLAGGTAEVQGDLRRAEVLDLVDRARARDLGLGPAG